MSLEDSIADKVRSPLHKLQNAISKDIPTSIGYEPNSLPTEVSQSFNPQDYRTSPQYMNDNESVYSFESVSTTGRLLDRLDLDLDDINYEDEIHRRGSFALMYSTARYLDRDNDDDQKVFYNLNTEASRTMPVNANSSISLERRRNISGTLPLSHPQSSRVPSHSAIHNHRREMASAVSLRADLLNHNQTSSASSLYGENRYPPSPHAPMRLNSQSRVPGTGGIQRSETTEDANADNSPSAMNLSLTSAPSPTKNRNISSSSNASNTSVDSLNAPVFNPNTKFDYSLEKQVKQALQEKAQGNLREASYQLQTTANIPNNYPRAMYLYGKALKLGQGVKLNASHAIKWFSRCILVSYIVETVMIDQTSMNNYVTKLSEMSPQECVLMVKKNIQTKSEDPNPFELMVKFSELQQPVMNKLIQNNARDNNAVGGAYYQLGECVLQGQGSLNKDEIIGRSFMAKAASLGSSEAMVKLGELWSSKSKQFKKDLHQAAAWFRLGELFDVKVIGNSWIYKEKYTLKEKKK